MNPGLKSWEVITYSLQQAAYAVPIHCHCKGLQDNNTLVNYNNFTSCSLGHQILSLEIFKAFSFKYIKTLFKY